MEKKETIWICTNCGYSASKPFETDICPKCHMTFWKCGYCSCTLISATAPELCTGMRCTGTISEHHLLHPGLGRPRAPEQSLLDRKRLSRVFATRIFVHPNIALDMKAK